MGWPCCGAAFTQTAHHASVLTLQERRIAELESQLAESQQQLEAAQSNRTVTQEALDQASSHLQRLDVAGMMLIGRCLQI